MLRLAVLNGVDNKFAVVPWRLSHQHLHVSLSITLVQCSCALVGLKWGDTNMRKAQWLAGNYNWLNQSEALHHAMPSKLNVTHWNFNAIVAAGICVCPQCRQIIASALPLKWMRSRWWHGIVPIREKGCDFSPQEEKRKAICKDWGGFPLPFLIWLLNFCDPVVKWWPALLYHQ